MADVELDVTFESSNVDLDVGFSEVYVIDGNTAVKVIANAYSNQSTYAVGDYVIYEKLLYRCIVAISEPEDFNSEKWLNIKVTDDLKSVQATLTDKADKSTTYTKTQCDDKYPTKASMNSALENKMDKENPTGTGSIAVGIPVFTIASGNYAQAFGTGVASGDCSTAIGDGTTANHRGQFVFGANNIPDDSTASANSRGKYVEIVGNGGWNPSNARTLDWQGNETLAGDLTYNGNKSLSSEISRLDGRIDNLPAPMIFKGTLGVGGTIQSLPTASASNEGFTYKVITDGTYAGQTAKVGDVFTSNGSAWVLIPSGDEDNDTWRAIKVNGVEKLGDGISSGAVDFVGSDNIEVEFDANGNKVGFKTKNIYTKTEVDSIVSDAIYNVLPDDTASGSVANFNTSLTLPIKSLEVDVNAVQESGTPTPATPLPISGWSAISLVKTGTNIWNGVTELGSFDTTTGEKVANNNLLRSVNPIPVKPNETYMRLIDASLGFRVFYYDKNMNFLSTEVSQYTQLAITIPSDCYFMNIAYQKTIASVSINYPSNDTSFHTYDTHGNTEVINLGGTYYGGYVSQDKNGKRELVVTHNVKLFSDLEFRRSNSNGSWSSYVFFAQMSDKTIKSAVKCSHYDYVTRPIASMQNETIVSGSSNEYIYVRDDNYTDVPTFKTANANTQLWYELAEPFTVALPDGEPIITLAGANNIFADTGDTSVVFKSSVNDYVSAHSGGNLLGMGGVYLGGAKSGGGEEEPDEGEDTEKTKLDEPKEEIKTIGDTKKLGGE